MLVVGDITMPHEAPQTGGSPAVSDSAVPSASADTIAGGTGTTSDFRPVATPSLSSGLLRAFRRRWLIAGTLGLLAGGVVGALLWLFLPEQYSAEVRLRLPPPGQGRSAGDADERLRLQKWLQSSTMLEAVLRRPEAAELPSLQGERDPLAWLGSHLAVEIGPTPDILLLRVRGAQAGEATQLVGTVVAVYRQEAAQQREAALRQLQDTRRQTEESIKQKQRRLAQQEKSRLSAAEKEGQQARFDLRIARAELAAWEKRCAGVDSVTVAEADVMAQLRDDPEGRRRIAELDVIEEQIKQVIRVSVLRERDPSLPAYYRQRDEARKNLKTRREEIRLAAEQQIRARAGEDYQKQLNLLRERVGFYEKLAKTLEEEVQTLGGTAAAEEQKTLREDIAAGNDTLRKLGGEIDRAASAAAAAPDETTETIAVRRMNAERRVRLAGLGGAGSCALLVLAVSWREFRLRRITASSDVVRGLGLPVVGNVPDVRGRRAPTLADLEGQGRVSEAVDALRTVLLRDGDSGPRLLLVTSAVGQEGKTSLAVQLAASLARAWRKTLLVDADLRKPEAHTLFETPLEPGLSEVLRGEAEVADVIQPTGLNRLWLISAGHWDTHAIQALAQEGAGRFFDRLKEQFDFIVLDACAVLPVADVLLLSTHVDGVLLAVRSGVSQLPIVQAAQQRLATLKVPLCGAVLMGQDGDLAGRTVA